ncbi:hypothetical protein HG536_0A06090 [Torulaspora globosa]|uniref:Transcription factor STP1 n=1 Tax=Torulaspora globosa TaxID=48254 RepID=A0A7G3ZBA8_9SACH|nr:uncharacterized protein HG536_0A06090 [Torulaspora globosa]QLL30794.1 hypothetical protein HG536_0A06090 [Torulaspora globosa]
MPSISFLSFGSISVKDFTARIVQLFKQVVESVVVSEPVSLGDENDVEDVKKVSLFPEKHNLDTSVFTNSSVIPCSLDITGSENPMTVSVGSDGKVSCKLAEDMTGSSAVVPITPESNKAKTPTSDATSGSEVEEEKEIFVCHYCDAKFRIRGYLTRHIKKHAIQKAYHCPFFNASAPSELRCHNSGGFSRRDTYKTHLRARHFVYPKGVKPQNRSKSSGHCSQCGQFFENTDKWVEQHIENGECKGLPDGYFKNIKSERKSGKLRMIKVSTGHSRFISTAQSVVEPKVLLNKDALEAMAIVAQDTNRSDLLSKYGNNKIMMSSTNFSGVKSKRRARDKSPPQLRKENEDDSSQRPAQDFTPLESTVSDFMDDETALNEISSSIKLSPHDHHALEPIPSASSQSSHEDQILATKGIQPVIFNDPFSIPLDMEQCSLANGTCIADFSNSRRDTKQEVPSPINNLLEAEMDAVFLGQKMLRDNEQFTNFYNCAFGSNL